MRSRPQPHPNSVACRAACSNCPKRGLGVILRLRTLPNLQVEKRMLCDRCSKNLGFLEHMGSHIPDALRFSRIPA